MTNEKASRGRSEHHDDHGGFARDLVTIEQRRTGRRRVLWMFGGLVAATPIAACRGVSVAMNSDAGVDDAAGGTSGQSCTSIPEETAGPYPGDGTNGPNALAMSGIERSDLRASLTGSAVAEGVPLTVTLTILDASCAPVAGRAVYLWHCDRSGSYSLYAAGLEEVSYLRGVQVSDANGRVTFTTIVPGCYSGRWPHMHFEVFDDLASATSGNEAIATSQLALPEDTCALVYATSGYEASVSNLASTSLTSDNVFRDDGAEQQLASVSGDVSSGFVASLSVMAG
ncbi:MAG: intradiol ring-cleavage dioxygenase [Deltaproteobacteria bacterium]|nr:intradiol ring-cleavage dioxygenase [Deltaproteobacteria bacterium]